MNDPGEAHAELAQLVRRFDPDRFFSSLFAPSENRPALLALYAFNHELARIGENVREPMLGEIRLQWWRESFEAARNGTPRSHEIAGALQLLHGLPPEIVALLIDARAFDFSPERFDTFSALEDYLDRTSGGLMRLAANILGEGERHDPFAREAGVAYGLIGLLRAMPYHARRAKLFLPTDVLTEAGIDPSAAYSPEYREPLRDVRRAIAGLALSHYRSARQSAKPGRALAAYLPAALVPLDVRQIGRENPAHEHAGDVPLYRRQLTLLRGAITGHI